MLPAPHFYINSAMCVCRGSVDQCWSRAIKSTAAERVREGDCHRRRFPLQPWWTWSSGCTMYRPHRCVCVLVLGVNSGFQVCAPSASRHVQPRGFTQMTDPTPENQQGQKRNALFYDMINLGLKVVFIIYSSPSFIAVGSVLSPPVSTN